MRKKSGRKKQKRKKVATKRKKGARVRRVSRTPSFRSGKNLPPNAFRFVVKKGFPKPKPKELPKLHKGFSTDVVNWNIDDEIAIPKTTFLLNYQDGNPIELNVRLQTSGGTFTHNVSVNSRAQLQRELMRVIRESKNMVESEINYLDKTGHKVSVLDFAVTSYNYGKGTMPVLIEILYS